jgi:hypothetical protein
MACKNRCPHHVRHGHANAQGEVVFEDVCGLRVKMLQKKDEKPVHGRKPERKAGATIQTKRFSPKETCDKVPFGPLFEYTSCDVYLDTFKTPGKRNDVMPTRDFNFSDKLVGASITDMDFL